MAPFCPEVLDLHRAMHQNLRLIREGASKDPSGLFDDAIRNSAQVVLLLANHLCFALEDRIQLLYEAGDYHEAQRVLDQHTGHGQQVRTIGQRCQHDRRSERPRRDRR